MKLVLKKIAKNLIVFILLTAGLLFARYVLAADFGITAVENGLGGTLAGGDPRELAGRIINIALGILGVLAVGLILYSGFLWMTSNGDDDKINTAKKILKNGLIGLVIILSSWAIATFILTRLGGTINGGGSGCLDGETQSCGCGGYMLCTDGSFGNCMNSNPLDCLTPPTSCDSSPNPGCQAVSQICAPGYFCDNTCLCQTQGNLGESCDADLSNQTCDADNSRCSEYLSCNPDTCLCSGPPVITDLSPTGGFCNSAIDSPCQQDSDCGIGDYCNQDGGNGAPNNFITIFGKNFGEYSATSSRVVFLGSNNPHDALLPATINPLCINSWRDDQIVVAVPFGTQTGPIEVINQDNLSDITNDSYGPQLADFIANNISRPGLCYIDPNRGVLSSEVSYQGINLYSGQAYFGNYQSNVRGLASNFVEVSGLTGTSTTPNIQAGVSGSFVERTINNFPQKSNYLKFIKDREAGEGPYIVSFSPTSGNSGQYVTVKGGGFGGARGTSHVYFARGTDLAEAVYDFPAICANSVWRDSQVIVKVPENLPDDNYQIQMIIGSSTITTQNLNPNAFTFDHNLDLKSSLCKINPEQGPIATPVTLWGEYFGAVGSNGLVRFNYNQDTTGPIVQENDANTIQTEVPAASVTGPVGVIKNNEAGNELNFIVAECASNDECNNQICCPANTYKKGHCVDSIDECFTDIPTSVFEWSFSTSFEASTTPVFDSCSGYSQYSGSCYQGAMCPNSPGACSSPETSYQKIVGSCDISCQNATGCTAATCTYDSTLDKCVQNIASGVCDLAQSITFSPSDYSGIVANPYTTEETCNADRHWEIISPGSCPIGWTRTSGNRCVNNNSSCDLCPEDLVCAAVNSEGRCVSQKLCADIDAKCINTPAISEPDNCVIEVAPSCECCCRIGRDTEDCCAPLTCAGQCGSDLIDNSNTYGSCSGCAAVGTTVEEHDAACNCSGHTSQYCDISSEHPAGICTDCSGITNQQNCGDHSSACCFDSNKTATTTDDICRGVNGGGVVSTVSGSTDYGYCAYYNCFSESVPPIGDPLVCASTTPLRVGFFQNVNTCIGDCPSGIGGDPCRAFDDNAVSCTNESNCCFDASTANCLSGTQILGGPNNGYCAYYNCQTPPGNPLLCDPTPTTTPIFASTSTCALSCANPAGGAGLDCSNSVATSTCNFGLCNFPGFACLLDSGAGGAYPSCGTCCCQVGNNPDSCISSSTPNLHCQADQGACSGAGRGLCCGCSTDSDCGSVSTTGCGTDTCCQARPTVVETEPAAAATDVCRNAALKITFNESMDITSFGNNFVLFEEKSFGTGVCPSGTYLTDARLIPEYTNSNNQNLIARVWQKLRIAMRRLFPSSNSRALATPPDPAKLYCAVPGTASAVQNGTQTELIFTPVRLLSPATRYYAVIKGDEALDSASGILSYAGIGLNERGLNEGDGTFVASALVRFNDRAYLNSYSFEFTTLSDQGLNAGICAVDHVELNPVSYLFKTTVNDLNENDIDFVNRTFDTKADRDKVFTANAYSADDQLLHPVVGYRWSWQWSADNSSIVDLVDLSLFAASSTSQDLASQANRRLVVAQPDIVDAQTKVNATINMDAYRPQAGCGNLCNAYFGGDGETKSSDVYIFLCDNPWPPVLSNGNWFPWNDAAGNCAVNPLNCENFNYKFYYCRDAGEAGTLGDLPAIMSTPVVRGQGNNLLCSSDKTACSTFGSACGRDQNGDGNLDGLCFWNVLKESYFFREAILPSGEITDAFDTGNNGEVQVNWSSPAAGVVSYKIYYLKSGQSVMSFKEVSATSACTLSGQNYNCSSLVNNLVNGQPYVFKLSVISANRTESELSNEKIATPTDQTTPSAPTAPQVQVSTTTIIFSWPPNPAGEGVSFYRLYRGVVSGVYGESFDSGDNVTSMSFARNQFSPDLHYFSLSAFSANQHESDKSTEVTVDLQ